MHCQTCKGDFYIMRKFNAICDKNAHKYKSWIRGMSWDSKRLYEIWYSHEDYHEDYWFLGVGDMRIYSLVGRHQCFRGKCCLILWAIECRERVVRFTPKMEAAGPSGTLVMVYQTIRCHMQEHSNLQCTFSWDIFLNLPFSLKELLTGAHSTS
jgi:hypothetical protein